MNIQSLLSAARPLDSLSKEDYGRVAELDDKITNLGNLELD